MNERGDFRSETKPELKSKLGDGCPSWSKGQCRDAVGLDPDPDDPPSRVNPCEPTLEELPRIKWGHDAEAIRNPDRSRSVQFGCDDGRVLL